MKTQQIFKKLTIKKTTIANLDKNQMVRIVGGDTTVCFQDAGKTDEKACDELPDSTSILTACVSYCPLTQCPALGFTKD